MSDIAVLTPADDEWHQRRRTFVGGSEVAQLLGLPTFGGRTIADLWYEKKFGRERQWCGNASTRLGLRLESIVLEAAEERLGTAIVDRQRWITRGCNAVTLDGRAESTMSIVEAKTAGIIGPSRLADFGADGSDDVPENYLVQCQAALLVTGAEIAYLAALIGGRGFAMFEIHPQLELQQLIADRSREFIESLAGDVPPAEAPTLETLKRICRVPDKVVRLEDDLVYRYQEAVADAKAADSVKESHQRALLAALGNAQRGEFSGGAYDYAEQSRKEFISPASSFRVLRFRKK